MVDAALWLFLERGDMATTIEAIARKAAVAPATVYQAFGTKHAILARILDRPSPATPSQPRYLTVTG